MKKLYILFLIFSVSVQGASSDTIAVFSESVKANFKKYVSLSNKAYNKKNTRLVRTGYLYGEGLGLPI